MKTHENMKIRMFLHHSIVSAEEYSKVPPSGHAATAAATIAYRVAEKTALQRGLSFSGWLVQACSTRAVAMKFRKARPRATTYYGCFLVFLSKNYQF